MCSALTPIITGSTPYKNALKAKVPPITPRSSLSTMAPPRDHPHIWITLHIQISESCAG